MMTRCCRWNRVWVGCNCNIWVMCGRSAQLQLRRLIIPCCANWWHADSELQRHPSEQDISFQHPSHKEQPWSWKATRNILNSHWNCLIIFCFVSISAHGQCVSSIKNSIQLYNPFNCIAARNVCFMLAQALVLVLLAIFFFRWWFLQLSKWGREARDRALQAAGIVFSIF